MSGHISGHLQIIYNSVVTLRHNYHQLLRERTTELKKIAVKKDSEGDLSILWPVL